MSDYPSIFNDVVGPVMRGPSSSHCAASLRIGRLCRDLMDGDIGHVLIEFDPHGSLATTHKGQGSDMGLFAGFLGWEAFDDRLQDSEAHMAKAGIKVAIEMVPLSVSKHPNTYQLTLNSKEECKKMVTISTGGGMIEVISIDGATVSMAGDYYETLIYCSSPEKVTDYVKNVFEFDSMHWHSGEHSFLEIKAQQFMPEEFCNELKAYSEVQKIKKLAPLLPSMARNNVTVPFITVDEMLKFNTHKNLALWELALAYESERGNIPKEKVFEKMRDILHIMEDAIRIGLKGTHYKDRILGSQSLQMKEQLQKNLLIGGEANNRIVMYVSATMEVKSSMGVIVAAPTAGSCGALPGAIVGMAESLGVSEDDKVKALLAAGLIGVFIAAHATFAAEVGGCMAETGSGGGMAAAGIVGLANGTLEQSLGAASLALQNSLGLICDPIGNRVEAPCLGRNVMAATNAVACANMALSNYDALIPLDEVIATMKKVGDKIDNTLRCTNLGGLSITPTAKRIEGKLAGASSTFYKVC